MFLMSSIWQIKVQMFTTAGALWATEATEAEQEDSSSVPSVVKKKEARHCH
jgi:hypothetical protein